MRKSTLYYSLVQLKHFIKLFLFFLLDILGVNALCRRLNGDKNIIIWYHGIYDDGFDLLKGFDERHISSSVFRQHLKYLKDHGYVFLTMTELIDAIKNKKSLGKSVVLTFDDGFQDVVENAYPIMKEYGAKGCLYLVSNLTGANQLLWTDLVETVVRNQKKGNFHFTYQGETINYVLANKKSYERAIMDIKTKLRSFSDRERQQHLAQFDNIALHSIPQEFKMATWEQIKELDSNVLEIGSHTRRHPNCPRLTSEAELEDEISLSKVDIERNTGRRTDHFCYPAGAYNEKVIATVKKSGYTSAVTIKHGFNNRDSDVYQLKRIGTTESFLLFKANISGSYPLRRR